MDEEERLTYALWGKTGRYASRIASARRIINRGLEVMRRPYASMSFGKDSTVMVHLLLSIVSGLPIVYVNCGEWDEWPDTMRVKRKFLDQYPCNFTELRGASIMEFYREAGFYIQDEEATGRARNAQRRYGDSLADVLDAHAHQRGYDGSFIGVRKEESDNRQRLFAMRGPVYYAKTRKLWACHPLAFWTGRDVWAYIVEHDLPYNELYDIDPRGRELARNGAMLGSRSARYGRMVFMQRMYPEWFNRFAAEFPEVRAYV